MLIRGSRPGAMTDYGAVRTKAVAPSNFCAKHPNCGCQAASCCFDCPLPECSYVVEQRPLTARRQQKAREMRDQGMSPAETARELGVSVRTVWRALGGC